MTRARRLLLVGLALAAIALAILAARLTRATPHVRDQVVAALNDRLDGDVVLEEFQVRAFPRPAVAGAGLSVRLAGDSDEPPLVRIGRFSASAGLLGLAGTPVRLRRVDLERLELNIPRERKSSGSGKNAALARTRLTIDEIVAHRATLRIPSKEAGKLPRVFDIHDLHIFGYGREEGAGFRAVLTNPTPEGRVETRGRFGPWQPDEPRRTPVSGEYTFSGADMNTIKGLGGTLSSRGTYSGVLERIEVTGETETPDFSLDIAAQPVPLTTRFKVVVDGTNGNTWLEQVDARLAQSDIRAKGAVVRTENEDGRRVALDVRVDRGRIEDFLKLAVKGTKPPLVGAVRLDTTLVLPAGDVDVVRKLRLDGEFLLDQARFTSFDVQKRINALSQKGRGDEGADAESVVSKLTGRFVLKNAVLSFSRLSFAVPGAIVQLAGTYHLEQETLDFKGDLLLDASLSETTSGIKAAIAKLAQPLFRRKGGGSKIPIRVGGTRSKPEFGLHVKRALLPG